MLRILFRAATILTIFIGFFLLSKIIFQAFSGTLTFKAHSPLIATGTSILYALGLRLPVPFHVMSVGLVLQKKWLSPAWAKTATWAVTLSGMWLGAALVVKMFVFH